MKFNSSARFNRKSFNSEKLFDAGVHDAGTVENTCGYPGDIPLTGWGFRKEITITNENANTQIQFTVNRSTGVDAGYVVYVDTKCEDDYDDIRFTAADGTTLLPYWIESSDSNTAYIWVKTNGETTMYLCYGNASATAVSSGTDTFDVFVDKTVTTGWTTEGMTVSASGDFLRFYTAFGGTPIGAFRAITISVNQYILEYQLKNVSLGIWDTFKISTCDGSRNDRFCELIHPYYTDNDEVRTIENTSSIVLSEDGWTEGTEYILKVIIDETNSAAGISYYFMDTDRNIIASRTGKPFASGSPTDTDTLFAGVFNTTGTCDGNIRWLFARKYAATEPSVSVWGAESTGSILPAPITEFQFTHTPLGNITNAATHAYEFAPANITATIENSPEVWCSVFIDTTPVFSIPFSDGSSEIVIGDIITGVTSGATGTVTLVVVTGGTWGAGTAAGYIIVENITGTFLIGEHIDAWTPVLNIGSTTGDATTTYYLPFTAGTDEFIVGSVVTGALSGATGTVISVDVTSGDWGTGDAEGYIRVINTSVATFINGEDIDGSHAEATDNSEQLYTLWYNCGTSALTAGKTVTGVVSGATAFILTVNLLCGEWGTNNAKGILDVKNVVGTFRKGELIADGPIGAPGTGVARVLELPAFIYTTPVSNVNTEPKPGTTLTGDTSGATGPVSEVIITSGTYGGGDAAGYILVTPDIPFVALETMTGRVPDWQVAIVSGDTTRVTPKVIERSCWKSIDEVYWQASLLLDGLYAFSDVAGFKELYIDMPDHTATSQRVFYGFIPNQGIVQNPGDNTTRLTAYSHAYNLANQFIPDAYRDTVEWVPSGATGYVTFSDPSVPITAFLGGSLWNLTTGIQPQNILTITDWGTSDIPIRGFAWGPEVNKWQAIQEMADYCGYVFEVQYDSSQDCAVANFCAVDDIDTYLGVPAAVTFDKGDASKYVLNVSKERRGTEMINRVRVQGRRNKRILNFVEGVTEFTAGHTVVDGLTGAEATIISCTKTAGAWGGTAIGYLIISYDRTGDFVHDSTIIDALGAGFGQATMQGNSVIYETYDEYTYSVESPAVTNLEERARERFFALEEEYDSTPLIEAKCQAYYDMYALDPTPYNVTFRDRCDLRLWQKVKLTSFTEIPEDWMRIVSIRYTQRSGGAVDVQCTLNNADYVIAQRKMRRSLKNNDVTEIEKIVKAILAKKEVKVGEALKVQGEGITIELQDGERVVVGRAPE